MRPVTLTPEQLEWIVAEVVRRLREGAPATRGASAAGDALTLSERLVTLETLRGRLNGVARVEVKARAVVTPAVIDLLKEKQVQLVKGAAQ